MSFFKLIGNCIKYSDKFLWGIVLSITIYSLILVGSISREGFNYLIIHTLAIGLGLIAAILLQTLNYATITKYWKWIALTCVLLIIYTLIFGTAVEGSSGVNAKAWIKLPGGITFQPSELVKIGFVITFAVHLNYMRKNKLIKDFKNICFLLGHALVPVILTHFQGDDGAAIIFLLIAITMAFVAGIPFRYFLLAGITGLLLFPIMFRYVLADYQKKRLLIQLNPESDPLNMGYQQIQGKLSIGSGGLFGKGLFNGPRVASGAVPIQESDFIFSAAGEELGFIGCIIILILLFLLILRIAIIANKSGKGWGHLICFGFVGLFAAQTILNIGMCLNLLPVIGVTLPFFSVGGSSAACLYLTIGITQNIYMNKSILGLLEEKN